MGEPTDISSLSEFGWYEWVYWRDETPTYPYPSSRLGRALGPSDSVGTSMSQWVLMDNCKIIPMITARKLTQEELLNSSECQKRGKFDRMIAEKFGSSHQGPDVPLDPTVEYPDLYEDDKTPCYNHLPDVNTYANYDEYLSMEVLLPQDEGVSEPGQIIGRSKDHASKTLGKQNNNPLLDTRLYDVQFPDGSIEKLTANRIAINLYASVDEYGYRHCEVKRITGH